MSIFTQRHYKEIAKLFLANKKYMGWEDRSWVSAFADMFEKDNPKFKRLLFLSKCHDVTWKEDSNDD